jgi:hypothetical protein
MEIASSKLLTTSIECVVVQYSVQVFGTPLAHLVTSIAVAMVFEDTITDVDHEVDSLS